MILFTRTEDWKRRRIRVWGVLLTALPPISVTSLPFAAEVFRVVRIAKGKSAGKKQDDMRREEERCWSWLYQDYDVSWWWRGFPLCSSYRGLVLAEKAAATKKQSLSAETRMDGGWKETRLDSTLGSSALLLVMHPLLMEELLSVKLELDRERLWYSDGCLMLRVV